MKNKDKILFIYPLFSTFVKADFDILSERFVVSKHQYVHKKQVAQHLLSQIKLLFWLLGNISSSKAVYIWFADYHSFLPILFAKLLNKKSFLVLGGYDVTYIPSLDYGSLNNPIRSFCTKQSIKNATLNLAVSQFVYNQAIKIIPSANVTVLYNGINLKNFESVASDKKDIILTVGIIDSLRRIKLKGIDVFVKVAKSMPKYDFVIVGINKEMQNVLGEIPANLKMFGKVKHDDLIKFYKESKVYCQFSIVESFCLTLAEAMACGCTGVVADAGALPEVVGESGFIVSTDLMLEIIEKIDEAILLSEKSNLKAVKMIKDNFSLDDRKQNLIEAFRSCGIN